MDRTQRGITNRWPGPRGGRLRGERGAAITEAAIIAPWFFLLVFGILEFGLAFKDRLSLDTASEYGARMGAIQGSSLSSDLLLLRDTEHFIEVADNVEDVRIVVFRADGPDDEPSDLCRGGTPVPGECNVYAVGDADDDSAFGCTPASLDTSWCPSSRDDTAAGADYLGVWIRAQHPYLTGLFGEAVSLTATSIARIEPQEYS